MDGDFRDPVDGRYVPTINPATEEPLADVAFGGPEDVLAAIESARAAAPKWAALQPLERGKYLFRIARLIQERARELAVVETMDGGKPLRESRDVDIPLAAAHFFHYAGWADKLRYGVASREVQPLGVVGQIVPWNFPLLMAAWKLAPALACGNVAILKPAETTPLTALLLAEIAQEAELPPGVISILAGDGATGAALVRAPHIDKVAFTGSTSVGRDIQAALAGTNTPLTLELGGKSANIVFEDASLDQAVEGIVNGIFFNQGHVCCAGSRLLIQESVHDEVITKLWQRMRRLRVGDPLDKNTDVGAINSAEQLERIEALVAAGEAEGAQPADDRLRAARPRLLVCADAVHRRLARAPDRGRGDLRPGRVGADVPHPGRGDREGQQLALRAGRRDLDRQGLQGVRGRRRAAGRGGLAEHLQPLRPDGRVRRLQGVGLRPRGRRRRAASVPADRAMSDRLSVRKTYKLWIGGAFVRSESGRYDEVHGFNFPRGSRKDVRDAVAAARKAAGPWAARTAYNRGQILYRAAEALESRGEAIGASSEECAAAVDVLLHYAGWTDKIAPVLGGVNPVAAPFLSFSLPEPTGVVGIVAPDAPPLLGLVAELAPGARRRQRVRRDPVSENSLCPAWISPRCSGSQTCPAASSTCSPGVGASSRRRSVPTATSTRSSTRPATPSCQPSSTGSRPRRSSACATASAAATYAEAVDDSLERIEAVVELKTAWHPVGA